MSKRLGIFVFFDPEGQVGRYIEYLLEGILTQLEDLIIVCNGMISERGKRTFEKYTKQIVIRRNIGFDAGAYKDIINNLYQNRIIDNYDELLLFNDTFFGPFYSFENIFQHMENKHMDFWGITWHQSEYIPRHIQSYFINFGTDIVRGRFLYDFFQRIDTNTTNILSIILHMEFMLTDFLEKAGFMWATYVEKNVGGRLYYFPYNFLVDDGLPILKIKSFRLCEEVDSEIAKCIGYLKKHNLYDINLIQQQIEYKFQRTISDYQEKNIDKDYLPVPATDLDGIKKFSETCGGVYLFGAGYYGSIILRHIGRKNVKGYIVSDEHYKEEWFEEVKVYRISQINDKSAGVVVSMDLKHSKEVSVRLKGFYNVLYLWVGMEADI